MGCFQVNFVNVFSTVYGNGGSGEPASRDEVQGTRFVKPNGGSAETRPMEQHITNSVPATAARIDNVEDLRLQLNAGDPIDEEFRE